MSYSGERSEETKNTDIYEKFKLQMEEESNAEKNGGPKRMDYITRACLVACSKEKLEANRCVCVNNSRNYRRALEDWKNNNGSVTQR